MKGTAQMGMTASQARLLSITARLSDNEHCGQSVSYSKQRLADQTDYIQAEYNDALNKTKLTVLTGFTGADPQYTDVSYNLMTGINMMENNKQYVITDVKGRVLVTPEIARAFEGAKGNYNMFLAKLGYSQADNAAYGSLSSLTEEIPNSTNPIGTFITQEKLDADANGKMEYQKIHDAWDKYFTSIGEGYNDWDEHENGLQSTYCISWQPFDTANTGGYPIILTPKRYVAGDTIPPGSKVGDIILDDDTGKSTNVVDPINFNGTTKEQRELYDYAVAITEMFFGYAKDLSVNPVTSSPKTAAEPNTKPALTYYQNIYNEILANGYYTYTHVPADVDDTHLSYPVADGGGIPNAPGAATPRNTSPLADNAVFESMIRNGQLMIKYYSTTEKQFVSTTITEDQAIQDVKDERKIALAEVKYQNQMRDIERKDKKFDFELKKLDTEHNALQTEYDAVKSVIQKNIEKTFSIFS
jgi:hypothetical protein